MNSKVTTLLRSGLFALLAGSFCSCVYDADKPRWKPEREKKIFRVATRQLPPEPVYNRVRWVRPPQVNPVRRTSGKRSPLILPVVHYAVDQMPACEALLILAATSRYRTYCASHVESKSVTLDMLGTIDEISQELSSKFAINVVVDHQNQEVRFLAKNYIEPEF